MNLDFLEWLLGCIAFEILVWVSSRFKCVLLFWQSWTVFGSVFVRWWWQHLGCLGECFWHLGFWVFVNCDGNVRVNSVSYILLFFCYGVNASRVGWNEMWVLWGWCRYAMIFMTCLFYLLFEEVCFLRIEYYRFACFMVSYCHLCRSSVC